MATVRDLWREKAHSVQQTGIKTKHCRILHCYSSVWSGLVRSGFHCPRRGTESVMAAIFFCSSGLLAPTSLSTCCPSLRKKKVGVALMSHEVLKSCNILNPCSMKWQHDIFPITLTRNKLHDHPTNLIYDNDNSCTNEDFSAGGTWIWCYDFWTPLNFQHPSLFLSLYCLSHHSSNTHLSSIPISP